MSVFEAYDHLAEVIANLDPQKILELKADAKLDKQVRVLIAKKRDGQLSEAEEVELERYLSLDLLVNLAKARAQRILAA